MCQNLGHELVEQAVFYIAEEQAALTSLNRLFASFLGGFPHPGNALRDVAQGFLVNPAVFDGAVRCYV
jgi:hypothetical protein